MHKRTLTELMFVLGLLGIISTPALGQTTIDFEGLAVDELVANQFAGSGVTFENVFASVAGISLNEIDFPPSSGQTVVSGFSDSLAIIHLAPPMPQVSLNITAANVAMVSAFDENGGLLEIVEVAPNLGGTINVAFISSQLIGRVEVVGQIGARFLTIDDVFFSPENPNEPAARCDVDMDGDVDRLDVMSIFGARNQPANGADDPRDSDGDGVITVLDGRQCVLQCDLPACAIIP